MKKEPSIVVVGLGYWGPNLARVFGQLRGCRLAGLCDKDPGRLSQMRRLYPDVAAFSGFSSMLLETNPDAVVVATPVCQHFPLAREALLAGKHVFIEKPMAASTGECRELIKLASDRGLTLMVGHIFLYSAAIRMIRMLIESGELGDIRYINSQRLNLGLFRNDINVVWDLAPHDISIVLSLLGRPPVSVNCQGNASVTRGVEDVANLSMKFESNRFATIQTSWLEPRKIRRMTIVGTDRMIIYDDIEPREKIRIYDMRVEPPPHYDSFGEFQYSYHYGDCHIPHIEQEEPLRGMCQHFLDCIAQGADPLTGGDMGLDVVRILEACSMSMHADGGPVRVPGQPADPVSALGLVHAMPESFAC